MAVKTPVRGEFDGNGDLTGLSEFQSADFIGVDDGGTGAITAAGARTALGLSIGSDVQAFDAQLTDVAGLTPTDAHFIVGDGSNFVTETGNTARASLGLANSDSPTFASLTLTGNLTVQGTQTILQTETLTVDDNIIVLNSNATGSATADAGIEVERGNDTNVTLIWDESADRWSIGSNNFAAATFIGNLTGNVTGTVSSLSGLTSDDLAEGSSNLYATNERIDDRVGALLIDSATSGIDINYDDNNNQLTLSVDLSEITEAFTDKVGGMVDGGTESFINVEFDDTNDRLNFSVATKDEDDMSSNSASHLPTQQSVKAYVDTETANVASDTMTFTGKDFDVEASGNSISNIDVADFKSGVLDTDISSVSGSDDTLASAKAIKTYVDAQIDTKDALSELSGDSDDVTEGSTNLYFTNARARGAVSVTDSGGDGSLAYNSSTGVFTYTGPSQSEVLAHISASTGITISGSGAIATTITQYTDSDAQAVSINNVVEDTTPQLGGNLDINSSNITGTGNIDTTGDITITSTSTSSSAGPIINLVRDSASPADADYLGQIKFKGEDDGGASTVYAKITGKIDDASADTEDGLIEFATIKNGSSNIAARLKTTNFQLLNGTGLEVAGNATITGDLTVNGTTTTIDTTNTVVTDTLIELGNGTSGTPANDSGLIIERGSSDNAFIGFDESEDKFKLGTGSFTGASTGNLTISTGTLLANLEGNVTGNVTGNVSGSSGSTTGNAATATALASAQNFSLTGDVTASAVSFDGTGAVALATTIAAGAVDFAMIADTIDEDNMASDSATKIPTQQSVKAYVDSQVTAQDLDFQADSGGALSIDLDSETFTISGTSNEIETSGSGNTVTIGLPSATEITTSLGVGGGSTNGVVISQGSIKIKNGGTQSSIDLYCESSNAHYVRLQAPAHANFSGNPDVTLPNTSGTIALTSDITTSINNVVDSAYVQARQTSGGGGTVDSADIIAIVDSAYVTARFTGSGISLATARQGISVTTGGASGGGALSYDNSTGVLTFNPSTNTGGGGGGGSTADGITLSKFVYTADSGQVTFTDSDDTGTVLAYDAADTQINVYLNGILLVDSDDFTLTDSSTVTLTSSATLNDVVQIIKYTPPSAGGGGGTGTVDSANIINIIDSDYVLERVGSLVEGTLEVNKYFYTSTANQSVFAGQDDFGNTLIINPNNTEVYLNGILQVLSTDYTINANQVTLVDAADSGYSLTVIETIGRVNTHQAMTETVFEFDADSGQTQFTGVDRGGLKTLKMDDGVVSVFVNGVLISDTNDYTTTNTTMTLLDAADSGDFISIKVTKGTVASSLNTKQYVFTNQSGTTLTGGGLGFTGNVQVFKNGDPLKESEFAISNGDTITLSAAAQGTDEYIVQTFNAQDWTAKTYDFVGIGGQTVFSGEDRHGNNLYYQQSGMIVYLNGIALVDSADYVATNEHILTLNEPVAVNDEVKIYTFIPADLSSIAAPLEFSQFEYTATANQTVFSGADDNFNTLSYDSDAVSVYVNGLLLRKEDYTSNNGTSITLALGTNVSDNVTITKLTGNNIGLTRNEVQAIVDAGGSPTWATQSAPTNTSINAGGKLILDTSSTAITITLPSTPQTGDEVRIIDGTGNASTNNITIDRNGNNIMGSGDNLVIDVDRAAIGLVYYNAGNGWLLIEN